MPAVALLDHNCLECRHLSPPFIRAKAVPCGVGRRNSMSGCASVKLSFARGLLVRHRCRSRCSLTTMNAMTLDKWLPFRNEGSVVRCRLLCFPHAAGNATFYRPLRRFMPPEVDFCPVELPGRAARLHEPPFTSRSWSMYSSRSWKCHSVFLTTAWASAWPLRLPGNCARSRAATPCFCSFPAAGVPNSLPPIAPATPAVGPRFACNSAPVWRHACSSHATTGTHSCATAGLKSRSRARYGVCGRSGGSHYLSYHRICRRRRCRSFRFPAVLARLHPRKFSLEGIFTSLPRQPLSPRRSSRTCLHPWACTRQMRDRRYDASLRRSSSVSDR